jgi:hypothetical protein
MTQMELDNIRKAFKHATEGKVNNLYLLRNMVDYQELEALSELLWQMEKMKLTMNDFIQFSNDSNISIDKVLIAQGWEDDMLADAVIKAKEEAKERIKII